MINNVEIKLGNILLQFSYPLTMYSAKLSKIYFQIYVVDIYVHIELY